MELIIDDRQDKLEVSEELIEKIKDIILECLVMKIMMIIMK